MQTSIPFRASRALPAALLLAACAAVEPQPQPDPRPVPAAQVAKPAAPRTGHAAAPASAAKPASAATAVSAAAKPAAVAPAATAAAPLDLKSLESRLKATPAIGVFTKLTLKNQVDDLLEQFRGFYQGRLKVSLAELRHSYDLLVLKVLALLQDADASLASAIASSRESIWGILSDRTRFGAV